MMEQGDRRLETLLERLDQLNGEMAGIRRRLEALESLDGLHRELRQLNESLQAIAYAALGQRGPEVRRRR